METSSRGTELEPSYTSGVLFVFSLRLALYQPFTYELDKDCLVTFEDENFSETCLFCTYKAFNFESYESLVLGTY